MPFYEVPLVGEQNGAKPFGRDEASEIFNRGAYLQNYGESRIALTVFSTTSVDDCTILNCKVYKGNDDSGLFGISVILDGNVKYDREKEEIVENTLTKELQKICQDSLDTDCRGYRYTQESPIAGASAAWMFACRVLKETHPYAYDAVLAAKTAFFCDERNASPIGVSNVLSLFIDFPDEMEKILKISPRTIQDGLDNTPVSGIISSNKSKVPSAVLQWANKQMEPTKLLAALQSICDNEDANNAVIFKDFVQQMKRLKMVQSRDIANFYSSFMRLIDLKCGYTTKRLLDYLVRQNFFSGEFDGPYDEAKELLDYAELAIGADLDFDKYPADVFKAHNIMMRNVTALKLTPEEEEAFVANNERSAKTYELKHKGYVVIIPKTVDALVKEGNDLSHCVAGYSRRIAEGKTVVGFLRKETEPDVSLYTIEMSGKRIVQAKGDCNSDLPPEMLPILGEIEAKW